MDYVVCALMFRNLQMSKDRHIRAAHVPLFPKEDDDVRTLSIFPDRRSSLADSSSTVRNSNGVRDAATWKSMLSYTFPALGLFFAWLFLFNFSAGSAVCHTSFQSRCLAFTPEKYVEHSKRTVLEFLPAGTNLTLADNVASCKRGSQVVEADICRIALEIETSSASRITAEFWFPEGWREGRVLTVGNGGVDGCIKYEDLAYGSLNGFATAGANNGHNDTTLVTALDNEEVVVDFASRSLHTTVQAGKELSHHFYGRQHSKSYYLGCSLGGRQGINAADKYPKDFDGIFAGAPAVDFNNLYSWRASFPLKTNDSDSNLGFVEPEVWKTVIHEEVMRQCDGIDGVLDGIIEDPSLCHFDPSVLLCTESKSTGCLSPAQVDAVKRVYTPYTYSINNGSLIYPAMQPGMEIKAASTGGLLSGEPFALSVEWFKYAIHQNASWDPYTYSTADAALAEAKNPADIRTWPRDLSAFRQRGGKVLMAHGQQDQQISSFQSPRFYERIREVSNSTYAEMDSWMRYFRISGMGHCNSGPGAWVLGQGGGASSKGIPFDKEGNVLAALVEWVEGQGKWAPDTILGTKFRNDTIELGVEFRRRHCRWPLRNEYIGGNAEDSESWECREPCS